MSRILIASILFLAAAGASAAGGISRLNGGITAEPGNQYGNLDTVNGGITVKRGARTGDLSTVNGGIAIDDDARVAGASTVNGGIEAGERVEFAQGIETVNGGIRIDLGSRVGGDIATVNGGITIRRTEVKGGIHTVSGDIVVGARSTVHGGLLVEKPKDESGWNSLTITAGKIVDRKKRIPRIVIGPNAIVEGELRFEREVELFVHPTARIGKVIGAIAKPYTDTLPPHG